MLQDQVIGQLKRSWIQLEIVKEKKQTSFGSSKLKSKKSNQNSKVMEWTKILNWIKSLSPYGKALILVAAAAAIAAMLFGTAGCSVNHKVVQSAYNTATGDSIIIKYEQWGKTTKM